MLRWKKIREQGLSVVLIWDLFMIVLAMINLGLIVFDLTYLWLRPQYFQYIPGLADLYDPIKGIQPHPLVERYLVLVDSIPEASSAEKQKEIKAKIRSLSIEMLQNDFLVESGQMTFLMQAQQIMGTLAGRSDDGEVFENFWYLNVLDDIQRKKQFDVQVRPKMSVCFSRQRSLSGQYVDRFLWLDLPFLLIFVIEFFVRWGLAWRKKTYQKWYVFPFYNWYELLGLIPLVQFRVFRLFRVVSIYLRLRRSELTQIGDDFITRKVTRVADIITEEIADRVTVKIISGIQDEIRSGASVEIIQGVLLAKQNQIKHEVVASIRRILRDPEIVSNLTQWVQKSLEDASSHYDSLKMVPQFIKETMTRDIGLAIFHAFIQSISQPLPNTQGKDALEDILDRVLQDALRRLAEDNIGLLFQDITLEILENSKHVVAKKRWLEKE